MICVSDSVSEKRRCFVCSYTFLIVKMFYSFERSFTLSDLPFYSFPSVGVNRSGVCVCVRARAHVFLSFFVYICIYNYVYIGMCI